MKHKHHIIPKYRGGSDHPDNLVEVTVTQHAMFHYCNWVLWGNVYDKIAWRTLCGQMSFAEAELEAMRIGGRNSAAALKEKFRDESFRLEWSNMMKQAWKNPQYREKALANLLSFQAEASLKGNSGEAQQKRLESYRRIQHQQGETNSQYGTMWITNGSENRKVKKTDPMPEGYYPGRKLK